MPAHVIDPNAAVALVRAQFPEFRDSPVEPLETAGTDHAIFRIGGAAVARFPLEPDGNPEEKFALQAEAEFSELSPFPAPEPIRLGRPGPGYRGHWSVQTWVPGTVATPTALAESLPFAEDLARLIRALRGADTRGRQFSGKGRGGHLPDHDAWVGECLGKSRGLLDVEALGGLWEELRDLPESGELVMSHKDLIPANLLIAEGRLAGVLDAGSFGPADPALDLVAAWHLLGGEARAHLREHLDCGDVEWRRGAAWAFEQAIGLVWFYRTSNPAMSELGRSTLARLLED